MRRYLIVDDNRPLAENLAEILRDRGDDAVVTTSGPEALTHLDQEIHSGHSALSEEILSQFGNDEEQL